MLRATGTQQTFNELLLLSISISLHFYLNFMLWFYQLLGLKSPPLKQKPLKYPVYQGAQKSWQIKSVALREMI